MKISRYYIEIILSLSVFLAWIYLFDGYVGHWEEVNFFTSDQYFLKQTLLKPAGVSSYLAHFVSQFYLYKFLGALILTLLLLKLSLLTRYIVARLLGSGVVKGECSAVRLSLLSSVPAIALFVALSDFNVTVFEMIRVVLLFVMIATYLATPSRYRNLLFVLLIPALYFLLLPLELCVLFFTLSLINLLSGTEKRRVALFATLWFGLVVMYCYWMGELLLVNSKQVFALTLGEDYAQLSVGMIWWAELWPSIVVVLFRLGLFRRSSPWVDGMGAGAVLALVIALFPYEKSRAFNDQAKVNQALGRGEWDEAIAMASELPTGHIYRPFALALALNMKGELADKLFRYEVAGSAALSLDKMMDRFSNLYRGEQFYRLGLINEALHHTFQYGVMCPQGFNFRAIRRLIELNILKGEVAVAEKYLAILEGATLHGGFVEQKRAELREGQIEQPAVRRNYFVGARPFLSDMARELDANPSNRYARDYLCMGILLEKDVKKFIQVFRALYPNGYEGRLAVHYQEAIVWAQAVHKMEVAGLEVDPKIAQRFDEFSTLMQSSFSRGGATDFMKRNYGDTFWYYMQFVEGAKKVKW